MANPSGAETRILRTNQVNTMTADALASGMSRTPTAVVWASCQIRKIAGAHAPGIPGTFSPSPLVSVMHAGIAN